MWPFELGENDWGMCCVAENFQKDYPRRYLAPVPSFRIIMSLDGVDDIILNGFNFVHFLSGAVSISVASSPQGQDFTTPRQVQQAVCWIVPWWCSSCRPVKITPSNTRAWLHSNAD
jgi:hypothetical protein